MIWIDALGVISPVGDDAPNTMAGLMVGLQLFDQLDVRGTDGVALTGAKTGLSKKLHGLKRLGGLGLVALTECAAKASAGLNPPVVICSPVLGRKADESAQLLDAVTADAGVAIDLKRSRVFPQGRPALGEALSYVESLFRSRAATECYLLGVDSLTDTSRARRLWEDRRLLEEANPEGFIPGEAGVCLLLSARPSKSSMAVVAGVGTGGDLTGTSASGVGLAAAFSEALGKAQVDASALRALIHDSSGSRRHAEELALASQRPPFNRVQDARIHSPADYAGDTGAAAGPFSLAMAAFFTAEKVGEIGEGTTLVACLSDGNERTAAVVRSLTGPRRQ